MTYKKHDCLIGFTGFKGSGKDTAAKVLIEEEGFEKVAFAGGLKHMLRSAMLEMGLAPEYIEECIEGGYKELPCAYLTPQRLCEYRILHAMVRSLIEYQGGSFKPDVFGETWQGYWESSELLAGKTYEDAWVSLFDVMEALGTWQEAQTPRHVMQQLGTEWGRDRIAPDFWINVTNRRVDLFDRVVITDCRFPNEADYIRKKKGRLVRVTRVSKVPDLRHSSENQIMELPVDEEIDNNSSVEALRAMVLSRFFDFQSSKRMGMV